MCIVLHATCHFLHTIRYTRCASLLPSTITPPAQGEGVIDTRSFGPPVVTVNPLDRNAMLDAVSTDK